MRPFAVAVVLAVSAQVAAAQDADRVLRGTVVNEDNGAPIEGAIVIGQVDTAVSDQDGGFAVVIGPDERYLVISAPGFAMRSIGVENTTRVELTVSHEVIQVEGTAPRPRKRKPPPQQ